MKKGYRIWIKLERYVAYIAISLFLLSEFLSIWIPWVNEVLNSRGGFVLTGLILISIYRMLDERIPDSEFAVEQVEDSFNHMIARTLGDSKHFNEISIFANTSIKHFEAIRNHDIQINKLNLLISNSENFICNLTSDDDIKYRNVQLDAAIGNWQLLVNDGKIENLVIRKYDFCPGFHFILVNGVRAGFGFYRPEYGLTKKPTYRTMSNYSFISDKTLISNRLTDKKFVADLNKFFTTIFKDYSEEVTLS